MKILDQLCVWGEDIHTIGTAPGCSILRKHGRGAAFTVFKLADEIAHIIKAGVHGDLGDRGVGGKQQGGCLIDTVFI